MARALASLLGLPHVELDTLFRGAGWVPRPEFAADVAAMVAGGRWVTEYQYAAVQPSLLRRAEVVVWLDHPFPVVAARLLRRSLLRALSRQRFHNGNIERPSSWVRASHPLRVVFSREFAAIRHRNDHQFAVAARRGTVVVRLRGARRADRWLTAERRRRSAA